MAHSGENVVRESPLSLMCGDSQQAAVEFLRRELSEEVQDQFREVIRVGALGALDAVVGRVIQQMLRSNGFDEGGLGVERLDLAWRELVRRAVA